MAVSKSQQKAVNKYMAANYDRINLTVPKGQKETIQAHATVHSESVNGFIGRAILETMERDSGGTSPQAVTGRPATHFEGVGISLPPETLKAVQEASEATGETQTEFVIRAVGIQVQRDKATLKLGINPATGDKLEYVLDGGTEE